MDFECRRQKSRICIALHTVCIFDMWCMNPFNRIRKDNLGNKKQKITDELCHIYIVRARMRSSYFLANSCISNIHFSLRIYCNIGRDYLIIVEANTEMQVWVQIYMSTLDRFAQEKLFMDNLTMNDLFKIDNIILNLSQLLPLLGIPTLADHRSRTQRSNPLQWHP